MLDPNPIKAYRNKWSSVFYRKTDHVAIVPLGKREGSIMKCLLKLGKQISPTGSFIKTMGAVTHFV